MIHGAFFREEIGSGSSALALSPVDQLDGNVREFLEQKEAFLVGVCAYGDNLQYVHITNDLWNSREYLYVPALGTKDSGNVIWWLPSPMRIIAGSEWTVKACQNSGTDEYENVILFLSYGEVFSEAPRGGIISRRISGTPTTGPEDWVELGTISDLEPSKRYNMIGCSGGIGVTSVAIRVRADSFQGLTPVFPAVSDVAKGTGRMVNELPEGMPLSGDEPVTVDIYQSTDQEAVVYVFFAREVI